MSNSLDALNSKLLFDNTEKTYTENGWTVRYRYVAKNKVNLYASKVVTGGLVPAADRLEIAALPFTSAYLQYLPCLLHVANTPVGYGRCRTNVGVGGQSGFWISNTSYPTGVEMQVFGDIIVS